MRTFLRGKARLLFVAFAVVLAVPAIALADNIVNDIDTTVHADSVVNATVGDTVTVGYLIQATGAGQTCDAADGTKATLTPSKESGPGTVTISPTSQDYTACDTYKTFDFSADTPGDYVIAVAVADTNGDYNTTTGKWKLRVAAATATNHPPTVSTAAADASGNEGSQLTTSGAFSDQDGDNLNISIVSGAGQVQEGTTDGTWSWSYTPNDNGSGTVVVQASDGTDTVTDSFNWSAANVPPTVSSVTASVQNALVDRNVTFTGSATDPSSVDTTAGFFWQFSTDGTNYTPATIPNPFASNSNQYTTSFSSCGTKSVSAKATDKDGGTSAPVSSGSVNVYNGHYLSPLNEGMYNTVQAGRVVPVKISVGCASSLTGLSPSIQLLKGEQDGGEDTAGADNVETLSVSAADQSGVMRAMDGGYIYNLQVPSTAKANDLFTIRVNPFATTTNSNPAGSAMYVVLKIRK